jgi:hypothetical protein
MALSHRLKRNPLEKVTRTVADVIQRLRREMKNSA